MANVDGQVRERNTALDALHLQLCKVEQGKIECEALIPQLLAEYPAIASVAVTVGRRAARGDPAPSDVMVLPVDAVPRWSEADLARVRAGLAVRFSATPVEVLQSAPPLPVKRVCVERPTACRSRSPCFAHLCDTAAFLPPSRPVPAVPM